MAKGANDPKLHLTPVPSVLGGTVNRLTKRYSDAPPLTIIDGDEVMLGLAADAINPNLPDGSRLYAAREAIEISEWSRYDSWSTDECAEFDAMCQDDDKMSAALEVLRNEGLTAEQLNRFGAVVSEQLWSDRDAAIVRQIADDEDDDEDEKIELARHAAATTDDISILANFVTEDSEEHWVLGALENPIATPAVVDRAARHRSMAVRQAAALHPQVTDQTLIRLRTESVNNAEVLDGYNAPSVFVSEFERSIYRQQAAANRNLVAVIDQLMAYRKRDASK